MALIQLNINRLGQGWFILWEEAELGGSLGVYQADGWRDGRMWDSTCGLLTVPGDCGDDTTTALSPSSRTQG